ncbi:MAG: YiiX/YebB-like N1pC/P60 family cysteine hydrolase [Polyangiaceae bacterium]
MAKVDENKIALHAGRLLLPTALGLLIGFWCADHGMRFVPDALILIASVVLVSCGLLSFVFQRQDPRPREKLRASRAGVALAVLALLALFWIGRPSALTEQSATDFERTFVADQQRLRQYTRGMTKVIESLERQQIPPAGADSMLSPDQESALLDSWVGFRDYAMALDQIRAFHEDYYRFDVSRRGRLRHIKSVLLTFAAELTLYEQAARFASRIARNENARKFINTSHEAKHLPAGSLSLMRQELLGVRDQARLLAGEQYLHSLAVTFNARQLAEAHGLTPLWKRAERSLNAIDALGKIDRTEATVRADLQLLKRALTRSWYPIQKGAAEKLGDTRVRRIGEYLIDKPTREKVDKELAPGDVLLARKNWYLSNLGLPGFWPHAILYLGTPAKLAQFFDEDPATNAWVAQQAGKPQRFSEWLAARSPGVWRQYQRSEHGEARRVIEAVSEGVVFSTLGHCAGDYMAALRPRIDKRAKAQAIAVAFLQIGKPYDFDFDFATSDALVCTELVWRALRSAKDKQGVDIPLSSVAGRMTLPANDIATLYAQQHGKPDRMFDFVAFIDANEGNRKAFVSDEKAFRVTHERPKWDVAQK